jgi:hypothetical protein
MWDHAYRVLLIGWIRRQRGGSVHETRSLSRCQSPSSGDSFRPDNLLANFNVPVLMRGVKRIVLNRPLNDDAGPTKAEKSHGERR